MGERGALLLVKTHCLGQVFGGGGGGGEEKWPSGEDPREGEGVLGRRRGTGFRRTITRL